MCARRVSRAGSIGGLRALMPPRTAVLPPEGAVGAQPSLPWVGGSVLVDVGLPDDVWVTHQGLQRAVQARVELGLDEGT
eukprot:5805533-Prymnesium_polylepis.1